MKTKNNGHQAKTTANNRRVSIIILNFAVNVSMRYVHRNCMFMTRADHTINVRGELLHLLEPRVMGILNATPDSFFAGSRMQTEGDIARRAMQIAGEGGVIIDVGACSTRPDSTPVDEAEEMRRLRFALSVVRRECPDMLVSVDTFRPDVTRMVVEEHGVDIINDVSAGYGGMLAADEECVAEERKRMFEMIGRLRVPYVLMSTCADLHAMMISLARDIQLLHGFGVKDIIVDPGFGFGKTIADNYAVMRDMELLHELGQPLLVGISRKSMIYKTLHTTPDEALNGTTALHAVALMKGASILRVHDVRAAVECVRLIRSVEDVASC